MRWIAASLLLVTFLPRSGRAGEPAILPTVPQVPAPSLHHESAAVHPASASGRVLGSLRSRIGLAFPDEGNEPIDSAPSLPATESVGCAPGTSCGGSIIAGSPIKRWLCYRPTTGHELPWLRPHPYVGPITGQLRCSAGACPSCAETPVCTGGPGCGKGLGGRILGRGGCQDGTCVNPADGSFPGYRFASPESPVVPTRGAPIVQSTSYKPTVSPTGITTPASSAQRTSSASEPVKRIGARQ
jgi:hypothetical protein